MLLKKAFFCFLLCCFIVVFSSFQAKGLNYRHLTTPDPLSIHILEVDPKYYHIFPAHAFDQTLGRETVPSIASRHHAVAAINGGFFKGERWEGLPAGILRINYRWFAFPYQPRAAIGWSLDGQMVLMDQLSCKASITLQDQTFAIDGLNRPRKKDEIILYSPEFNATTLTDPKGTELIIRDQQIVDIRNSGNTPIPKDGWVLAVGPCQNSSVCAIAAKGMPVHIRIKVEPQSSNHTSSIWQGFPHILGGTPLLIRNGQPISNFSSEKTRVSFLTQRYARTAVGLLPNGHWVFVVVDGNLRHLSQGMTMLELMQFMYNQGCIMALNLDGGGSSTMVIDSNVVNTPLGDEDEDQGLKKLRKVGDAILIVEKDDE